jgi:hypothetical protein
MSFVRPLISAQLDHIFVDQRRRREHQFSRDDEEEARINVQRMHNHCHYWISRWDKEEQNTHQRPVIETRLDPRKIILISPNCRCIINRIGRTYKFAQSQKRWRGRTYTTPLLLLLHHGGTALFTAILVFQALCSHCFIICWKGAPPGRDCEVLFCFNEMVLVGIIATRDVPC